MIMVLLVGHSNVLWPRPLHVKHWIELVLLLGSLGGKEVDVSRGFKFVGVEDGRLEEVAGGLEFEVPPLVEGARV